MTGHASGTPGLLGVVAPPCSVFRRHLKRVGLKYTTERADILDAATGFDRPFDVESLRAAIPARGRGVSKATVYRALKLLVEAGILAERPDARDCVRYESIHGRPAPNLELRLPDGSRRTIHDPGVARMAEAACRAAGARLDRHVLIVECSSLPPRAAGGRSRRP